MTLFSSSEKSTAEEESVLVATETAPLSTIENEVPVQEGRKLSKEKRIARVRRDLSKIPPIIKSPSSKNSSGGGEKSHESQYGEDTYKTCEKCKGSGRRWLIFNCGMCRGTGQVVEKAKRGWTRSTSKS